MSSLEVIEGLIAGYPQTERGAHLGVPDFRVRGKIFVSASAVGPQAVLKLPLMIQASLLESRPEAFSAAAGWGRFGWTIALTDKIDAALLKDLVDVAWRQTAPKSLVAVYSASAEVI